MKRISAALGCFLAAAIFLSLLPASGEAVTGERAPSEAQRYIVVYRDAKSVRSSRRVNVTARTARLERAYGFRSRYRYRHALKGFAGPLTREQVASLRRDSRIALIARDRVLQFRGRVPLAAGETVPTGISRIGATTTAGAHQASSVAVAVIDSGVDLGNSELNVAPGANCVGSGPPTDDVPHGTLVAGIIGARNTGGPGIVGVAPGTQLYAVKVGNAEGATLARLICGIDWVTANASALNIRVANLSLGGPSDFSSCNTDPLHLAICNSTAAGVTYTVAAGNGDQNGLGIDFGAYPPDTPAAFPEVLTVTAASDTDGAPGAVGPQYPCLRSELDDRAASFSNYAVNQADAEHVVAAPGVGIRSTGLGGQLATECGTSFSAPHVAGIVALCMGEGGVTGPCADMSPAEVIQQIRADAAANATPANGFVGDPNNSFGQYYGYMASALDPSVRRIPYPPVDAPAPPPGPADTTVGLRTLRIRKVQDVDNLRVFVRLGEDGTVTVRASAKVPSARAAARRVRFKTVSRKAVANRRVVLRPRLSRRSLRLVKRSLRRGRTVRASIAVVAQDRAGNSLTKRRSVRLRR